MNPFTRRRRRTNDPNVVAAVRGALDRHATDAPSGESFAERVLAAVERDQLRDGDPTSGRATRPPRRRMLLPVIAAASVVALVVGIVLPADQFGDTDRTHRPTAGRRQTTPAVHPPPTLHHAGTGSPDSASAQSGPATSHHSVPTGPPPLSGVRAVDLTFTSTTDGWALASADCLSGPGTCTALLHTTDGHTWVSATNPGVDVDGVTGGCPTTRCATNIRFATADVGYIFGPDVLYMTTDAGGSWRKQSGGAIALESADGNAVRVTSSGAGCPGPCGIAVETASNGSADWSRQDLGGLPDGSVAGAQLTRNGSDVFLLITGNPAGGSDDARSTLYRSGDDGRSWTRGGEPCPQAGGETDSVSITAGSASTIGALCSVRGTTHRFVATSRDAGRHFARAGGRLPSDAGEQLVGDPANVLLVTGSSAGSRAYRMSGTSGWRSVPALDGAVEFAGFESATVGRAVTDGRRAIETTTDGGASWDVLNLP